MTQEAVGTRKGDYEILALLGVGGMGQVYKVRNVLSDRIEAMKVLLPNLADQKMLADRFIREIKVLAGLHHANIAELRTALTIDNQLVMIMEFVEGATLSSRVQQGGIPYGQALGYIQQVLAALSYAHSRKIIHRDIKPANMMLTPEGVVKLMDFGIARQDGDVTLTTANSTVGSIAYMSPEQVKGEPVDARSDLYSVGVSLYELVTGQRPFQGDTGFSIMRAHLETMPKPPVEIRPELPVAISDLILMAVAKEPAKRFQSADAFSRAICSVLPIVDGTAASQAMSTTPQAVTGPASASAATAVSNAAFQATQVAPSIPSVRPPSQAAAAMRAPSPSSATPSPEMRVPPPANNYRGFYIALGALIVLVVLAAAGFYLPRHMKTMAAQQAAPASDSGAGAPSTASSSTSSTDANSSQPATSPAAADKSSPAASADSSAPARGSSSSAAAGSASASSPASRSSSPHISVPPRSGAPAQTSTVTNAQPVHISVPPRAGDAQPSGSAAAASSSNSQSQPPAQSSSAYAGSAASNTGPAADAADLQEMEKEVDQISSRADAVSSSLDGLRKAQAAQGLSLRGDMAAAEERMQNNISKAQSAVQAGNAAQAKHYLDQAEPDVEKLEKFLGR
jgi:serine/threonine protein kinase